MAPLCLACHLPLLGLLLFYLCLLLVTRSVSMLRVYDRLTLLNIRQSLEKLPIGGSDGHSKSPPPFLASIPSFLRHPSCRLPHRSRRRRRGKRGGVLVRLKTHLASSLHGPCCLAGYLQRHRLVRISRRGCVSNNLRPLSRISQSTIESSVHMALCNARSLINKTIILNDFFMEHNLDFLLLTETWI